MFEKMTTVLDKQAQVLNNQKLFSKSDNNSALIHFDNLCRYIGFFQIPVVSSWNILFQQAFKGSEHISNKTKLIF